MKTNRAALQKACASGALVRLERSAFDARPLDAFVLRVSDQLALLAPIRDRLDLDGYDVIRIADVTAVKRSPKAAFYKRALTLKTQAPTEPASIAIDSIVGLLRSLKKLDKLAVITREAITPDECDIGRIVSSTRSHYRIDAITPTAKWEPDHRRFRIDDVTRIQLDGAYERTLAALAGSSSPR